MLTILAAATAAKGTYLCISDDACWKDKQKHTCQTSDKKKRIIYYVGHFINLHLLCFVLVICHFNINLTEAGIMHQIGQGATAMLMLSLYKQTNCATGMFALSEASSTISHLNIHICPFLIINYLGFPLS